MRRSAIQPACRKPAKALISRAGAPVRRALAAAVLVALAPAALRADDQRPLSPAQVALFETPHLSNVDRPETLAYRFERTGPDALVDRIAVHIDQIHPDGTKYARFDFLTGEHRVPFPAVDQFSGNPLIMLFLEQDVQSMKAQFGLTAAYFRTRIREAFVDRATVEPAAVEAGGRSLPARRITLRPFADEARLAALPTLQAKTYAFVLADQVPGQVAELSASMPAQSERIQFLEAAP